MLRSKNGLIYEDGYHWLQGYLQSHFAELAELMQQEADFDVRSKFVELMGDANRSEAIPLLIRELESPSAEVRKWAYLALRFSEMPDAVEIAESFRTGHPEEDFL